jgi:RNA polymerase sigma factor (sigma-70 family)
MQNPSDHESEDGDERRSSRCSFCLKSWNDVGPLVEGPKREGFGRVCICRECVELCVTILDVEKRKRLAPQSEDSYFDDFIEAEAAESPINAATQEMLKEKIDQGLKTLIDREREIVKLRYGLGDGYTYTLEEVGRRLNITPEAVQEIERQAVTKLQSQNQPPLTS